MKLYISSIGMFIFIGLYANPYVDKGKICPLAAYMSKDEHAGVAKESICDSMLESWLHGVKQKPTRPVDRFDKDGSLIIPSKDGTYTLYVPLQAVETFFLNKSMTEEEVLKILCKDTQKSFKNSNARSRGTHHKQYAIDRHGAKYFCSGCKGGKTYFSKSGLKEHIKSKH